MDKIDVSRSRGDLVSEATANLLAAYEHLATSEALTRALVCERTEKSRKADFWVQVYLSVRASVRDIDEVLDYPSPNPDRADGKRIVDPTP